MYKQIKNWLSCMEKADKSGAKVNSLVRLMAKHASWKEVYGLWSKMIKPKADDRSADAQMYRVLTERLLTPEQPVLSKQFAFDNLGEFVQVPNNATAAEIKSAVKEHFVGVPMYVIEKSRKFRGIAVTADLVLAGVCVAYAPAEVIKDRADELGLKLLTREESVVANKVVLQLDTMAKAAGVPSLKHCFGWLIESDRSDYDAYSLDRPEHYWQCHPKESTYLVLKY